MRTIRVSFKNPDWSTNLNWWLLVSSLIYGGSLIPQGIGEVGFIQKMIPSTIGRELRVVLGNNNLHSEPTDKAPLCRSIDTNNVWTEVKENEIRVSNSAVSARVSELSSSQENRRSYGDAKSEGSTGAVPLKATTVPRIEGKLRLFPGSKGEYHSGNRQKYKKGVKDCQHGVIERLILQKGDSPPPTPDLERNL